MTDDQILQVAREVSDVTADTRFRITFSFDNHGLIAFAHRIAELEREACAHACDKYASESSNPMNFASNCAEQIRSRK